MPIGGHFLPTSVPFRSSFTSQSPSLPFLRHISLADSVAVYAIHLKVAFAVVFDQRSGHESHKGDGEELSQRPPGEYVIQRGDLGEDGSRTNTYEVVGDQTFLCSRATFSGKR